jgi:hypothetical protein
LKKLSILEQTVCHWQQEVVVCGASDPSTNSLFQEIEKLKKVEQDHELQQYFMNYCVLRVEKGEKDCEATFQKLASVISNLEVLDHQASRNKLWIKGLLHQIHLMSNGSKVLIAPLLVKSPSNLPASRSSVIVVMACPICGFYFKENDIIVAPCIRTYHPFCLVMFMESKFNKCAEPACGKVFMNHWINNFGFKHFNLPMKRIKVEKGLKANQSAIKSFQG